MQVKSYFLGIILGVTLIISLLICAPYSVYAVDDPIFPDADDLIFGLNPSPGSPLCTRNYIEDFVSQWPNDIPYTNQSYDCDDFANAFDRICEDQGFTCGVVHIFCDGGGHAVNVACHGDLCCGVDPQASPPTIIPGTCFTSTGVPDELSDGQCNLFCQGIGYGNCKDSVVSEDPMDDGDQPSVICWENQRDRPVIEQSYGICCQCCHDAWSPNPHGFWGESCQAQCQNILIKKGIPVYPCADIGYDLTGN